MTDICKESEADAIRAVGKEIVAAVRDELRGLTEHIRSQPPRFLDRFAHPTPSSGTGEHDWAPHERHGWSVCSRCGMVRNYECETPCRGATPLVLPRESSSGTGEVSDEEPLRFTGADHDQDARVLAAAFGIVGDRFHAEASDALMESYIAGEKAGRASLSAEMEALQRERATYEHEAKTLYAELAAKEARLAELTEDVRQLSDSIDGEHALNERLIREAAAKEARLAAWEPVVREALRVRSATSSNSIALCRAVDAIPAELRPGGKGE